MTLPKALPLDHPRVEQFRSDFEDLVVEAFESGVHIGVLIANSHRAAAMMMVGMQGSRAQFMAMAEQAWSYALEERQEMTALEDALNGNGAKA